MNFCLLAWYRQNQAPQEQAQLLELMLELMLELLLEAQSAWQSVLMWGLPLV